ncbi:hypothetical protein [Buttiauxella noackiae]|uniref:hypothetical protein n=1 Tax=Buttiauxella noackiae TaxID=82992 RepID=UPI002355F502|nr:hypothetical protein [Buttiauxella noackiae]MCA1920982.1 hypothetical protein [Buttiauxella noackiae]
MITGFGNNISSALASDITANQTAIRLVPGGGALFAKILTTDISNPSSPHGVYAKLTITDSQQTVFEICHLTAVSNDTLTVIRGQEGTTAKGWALNDVIANFATRGSEESFVQIEQLQGGDYTSATAGGTPNALTVSIPSTFSNNNSNDWLLKTPLLVTPIAANSGNTTLQLTLGGKVIGIFPLFKGNKAPLDAGDIIPNVPFICLLDSTKAFFTVVNPINLYSKLGTAAFRDVQTSRDDVTPGRVLSNGGAIAVRSVNASGEAGGTVADANDLPSNSVSFAYASAANSPGFQSSIFDFTSSIGNYNVQLAASYVQPGLVMMRTRNGDNQTWSKWFSFYTNERKPTADDVGALPTVGGEVTGPVKFKNNSAGYPVTLEGGSPTILFSETDSGKKLYLVMDGVGIRLQEDDTGSGKNVFGWDGSTFSTGGGISAISTLEITGAAPIISLGESDTGKKIMMVMDGSSIRLQEDNTAGREIWSWSTPQAILATAGSFSAAGEIHAAQRITIRDSDSGLRGISDGVVAFQVDSVDIGYFSSAGIGLNGGHSFILEARENNPMRVTNEMFNVNGQVMVGGVVSNWYNGWLAFGCQRGGSTDIAGFAVWQNGVQIFNVNANGNVNTNTGQLASQSWVGGNYCTIAQREALSSRISQIEQNYVIDVRLNGRVGIGADGWSAAPNGAVFNGGGDFGSDNGSYSYTWVQKYTNAAGWVTVQQV